MRGIQCPFPTNPVAAALLLAAFPAWADNEITAQETKRAVRIAEFMPALDSGARAGEAPCDL